VAAITLVATVSNCFVPRLPGAHALRGILTETIFERSASVDIIRVSAGMTVTVESKQQAWTKQSLPQRHLCVVFFTEGDIPEIVGRDSVLNVFMHRRHESHGVMYSA